MPRARRLRRDWPLAIVLAAVAFDATFSIAATHAHTPAGVTETAAIRDMVAAEAHLRHRQSLAVVFDLAPCLHHRAIREELDLDSVAHS